MRSCFRRAGGRSGSIGTNAAPVFEIANIRTRYAIVRTAGISYTAPGPAPRATSSQAWASEAESSSAYVTVRCPSSRAMLFGNRAAVAAKISVSVRDESTSAAVQLGAAPTARSETSTGTSSAIEVSTLDSCRVTASALEGSNALAA